jgi:hypothetical protein
MSVKFKHLFLLVVSIILVISSLLIWVPDKRNSQAQDIRFGYPLSFVSQDFTICPYFYTSSWYFKFSPSQKCPIKKIYPFQFIISWATVYLGLEIIVWILEKIKSKIKLLITNKK